MYQRGVVFTCRITQKDRELLIADVISSLAQDRTSRVETAYELLYALPVRELQVSGDGNDGDDSAGGDYASDSASIGDGKGTSASEELLRDFAAQCDIVLHELRA